MTDIWNAKTYSKFLDLRTRPAKDLLYAIPESFQPKTVCDLGCGPGNSTILLKDRWPEAKVVGLDSSGDMLAQAKRDYPQLQFVEGDLSQFQPKEKLDCIFSNAALQWVGEHETLIPKLFQALKPGGVLAIQMPNNWHCPSHQITIQLLQCHPKWTTLLKILRYGPLSSPFYEATHYYDILTQAKSSAIQIWETEYIQEVGDHQGVFNWVEGTGLRPILSKMDPSDQKEFKEAYVKAASLAYPIQKNGKVLLPFRRLFMVAMGIE
jgi:trans-aconitate 2-methyltransferase